MTRRPTVVEAVLGGGAAREALEQSLAALGPGDFVAFLQQLTAELYDMTAAVERIEDPALEGALAGLLDLIARRIAALFAADRCSVFFVDWESKHLWSTVAQSDDAPISIEVPLSQGVAGAVARTGDVAVITDAYASPLFSKDYDARTGYVTRSIFCAPVRFNGQSAPGAVVQLLNKLDGSVFGEPDRLLFDTLGAPLATILNSYQRIYAIAQRHRGLAALLRASESLAHAVDLGQTLGVIIEQATELIGAEAATVFLVDEVNDELWSKVATQDGKGALELRLPIDKGLVGHCATTGAVVNVPDAYVDPRFDPTADRRHGFRTRSVLCVPIFDAKGRVTGVTQLINRKQGTFTKADQRFLAAFNAQASVAIANAKLFDKVSLEQQYQRDILRSITDGVVTTDIEGRMVTVNDAAARLLHLRSAPRDRIPSHQVPMRESEVPAGVNDFRQLFLVDVLDLPAVRSMLGRVLSRGEAHYIAQQELALDASQTGELKHVVNVTLSPLSTPDGQRLGAVVILEDVSQEKRMRSALYRYMTPAVAEQVMSQNEESLMLGERREVSVLFSDIRDYTTLTEQLDAAEVVELLNKYFETMVDSVFSHQGTLDKFIGDALMAVFGAPLPLPETHPWMAALTALDMRRRLAEFNRVRVEAGQVPVRVGIGINTGEAVAGNIGSARRMDYTVIGDAVNLSSRLEGASKMYGCDIAISDTTVVGCQGKLRVRALDAIRVKGRQTPCTIYELIGLASEPISDEATSFYAHYAAGRTATLAQDFAAAHAHFSAAIAIRPSDKATQVHLTRVAEYTQQPPPTQLGRRLHYAKQISPEVGGATMKRLPTLTMGHAGHVLGAAGAPTSGQSVPPGGCCGGMSASRAASTETRPRRASVVGATRGALPSAFPRGVGVRLRERT